MAIKGKELQWFESNLADRKMAVGVGNQPRPRTSLQEFSRAVSYTLPSSTASSMTIASWGQKWGCFFDDYTMFNSIQNSSAFACMQQEPDNVQAWADVTSTISTT